MAKKAKKYLKKISTTFKGNLITIIGQQILFLKRVIILIMALKQYIAEIYCI